jgi:hypothetical protein
MKLSKQYKKENNLHVATVEILVDLFGGGCRYWQEDVRKDILSTYQVVRQSIRLLCDRTDFTAEKEWITDDEIMIDFEHIYRWQHDDEPYINDKTSKWFVSTDTDCESKL